MVIDAQGRLIAVPAYRTGGEEQVYRARAVELARPLLDAARSGRPYVSPHLVPATGEEQLVEVGWSDQDVPNVCRDAPDEAASFVAPESLDVRVVLAGLADGEDYRLVVAGPSGAPVASRADTWNGEGCLGLFVHEEYGALGSGTYTLTAYAGPSATLLGTSTAEIVDPEPEPAG